jgi:hypothetical protein
MASRTKAGKVEAALQRNCIKWLRSRSCICIKLATQGVYGTRGWPDYLICPPWGQAFFIEFKRDELHDPTDLQDERMRELRANHFRTYVCWSRSGVEYAFTEELRRSGLG